MNDFEDIRTQLQRGALKKEDCFFSLKDISAAFGVSYATARRWSKGDGFPRPRWRGRRPTWLLDDLAGWMMRENRVL